MTPLPMGLIALAFLFALLIMGVPVAFSMLLVGFFGMVSLQGLDVAMALVGSTAYHSVANWLYIVIPMFILMGEFAGHSGIVADIFSFFSAWVGRIRGSLAIVTILTSAVFSFAIGNSVASTAVMGKLTLPEMMKARYGERLALGSVLAGGTLGNLIPPSTGLVVYGILAEVSIGRLLIGGILPGLLAGFVFILWIIIAVKHNPEVAPVSAPSSWMKRLLSLQKVWGMLLLMVAVFASIYTGVATITEAATVGAFVTFLIAVFSGKLSLRTLQQSLVDTALMSAMIFLLLTSVMVFSRFLNFCGFTRGLVEFIIGTGVSRWMILGGIYLACIILGCIVDPTSLMLLIVPIFFPIAVGLKFDPIWFGIMSVIMIQIGLITPPVGLCVYALHGVSNAPVERCFASALPPLIMWFIVVLLLTAFPGIAIWLPSKM